MSTSLTIEDKQIAKEILLKMMDSGNLGLYSSESKENDEENLATVINAFNKILAAVMKQP